MTRVLRVKTRLLDHLESLFLGYCINDVLVFPVEGALEMLDICRLEVNEL